MNRLRAYKCAMKCLTLVSDPFEQQNRVHLLSPEERSFLHDQLKALIACKGRSCTMGVNNQAPPTIQRVPVRYKNKRKLVAQDFGKFLEYLSTHIHLYIFSFLTNTDILVMEQNTNTLTIF